MTQRDRVLRALEHGPVSTTDFVHAPTDGGKPILRLAARIHDLQCAGYRIRSERRLNGTCTYFLLRED
jgi:Helix-turn-helix domain